MEVFHSNFQDFMFQVPGLETVSFHLSGLFVRRGKECLLDTNAAQFIMYARIFKSRRACKYFASELHHFFLKSNVNGLRGADDMCCGFTCSKNCECHQSSKCFVLSVRFKQDTVTHQLQMAYLFVTVRVCVPP